MLKEVVGKAINKKFDSGVKVYSGIKDYYGNTCYVLVNIYMKELRVVAKDPLYNKRRKALDSNGLSHVRINEFLPVIDFKKEVADMIDREFPGYTHTSFSIWWD